MKKLFAFLVALLFVSIILSSCNSSQIEKDAKKLAELNCEIQKIAQKAATGDMSVMTEGKDLADKAAALRGELEKKYTSDSDKRKFAEALVKDMQDCK